MRATDCGYDDCRTYSRATNAGRRFMAVQMALSHLSVAVLWDLDGTLVDSRDLHWLAWREVLAGEGFVLSREQFDASFGQRNDTTLATWFGSAATRRGPCTYQRSERGTLPPAGAQAVSICCPALRCGWGVWLRGWRQALATSAPRLNVDVILEVLGIAHVFATIVTAEDVVRRSPIPRCSWRRNTARRASLPLCGCGRRRRSGSKPRRAGMRSIGVGPHHASGQT